MATKKVTLYPSKIKTQETRSTKTNTQILEHKENLKSSNTALAYWGVKNPTWKPSYLRRYPDSITTPSGSFNNPAEFVASGFTISGVNKKSKIKNIWVEYRWEQVSYSSTTAFGSFDKPTIQLKKGNKSLDKIAGAKPAKNRYDNCKKGSCTNTDSANLSTTHVHKFSGVSELTVKDLADNVSIVFDPAKNTASNHCRIIMQFFRIVVEYTPYKTTGGGGNDGGDGGGGNKTEPDPNFVISTTLDRQKAMVNEEYYCTVKIQNTNADAYVGNPLPLILDIPANTEIEVVEMLGSGAITINRGCQWVVHELVDNVAQIKFRCKTSASNNYAVYSSSYNYTTVNSTELKGKSDAWIKIISDAVEFDFYATNIKQNIYDLSEINYTPTSAFKLVLNTIEIPQPDAIIIINTDGLITENGPISDNTYGQASYWIKQNTNQYTLKLLDKVAGIWEISNIKTTHIELISSDVDLTKKGTGKFDLQATYKQGTKKIERNVNFSIIGRKLAKDYFKLRLEDGSDVQYNSLSITEGDDLEIRPMIVDTQELNQDLAKNMTIIGDTKRFSTKEAKYASFDVYIKSDEDKTYNNVIAYIDAYDEGYECEEIIVGADQNIDLYQSTNGKTFCIIRELQTNVHNKLKLILQSDEPREAIIKLKPFNYDEYDTRKWTPMHIYFKDIPNIQMKIKGPSEIIYHNDQEATFKLQYIIRNYSDIKGENVKFKLIEPTAFERDVDGIAPKFSVENNMAFNSPVFNNKSRIIYFPELDAHSSEYILEVTYKAKKKGIFEFAIQTLDDTTTIDDDQYQNIYRHKILVNITSDLKITTSVSNNTPYFDDIIDYTINVTNYSKRQERLIFNIDDIGHYDILHPRNDYEVIEWEGAGIFETKYDNEEITGKTIGIWTLNNVGINEKNTLVLSLKPKETGTHVIKTHAFDINNNVQTFENYVQIYEPDRKIDLNVYHAINQTENENCCNPDILTEICDDDFLSIGDDIYYVIEVINNERNDITKAKSVHGHDKRGPSIQVKIRLPKTFEFTNCATPDSEDMKFTRDSESGLLILSVDFIEQCHSKKFCFKVTPQKKGNFISNFILSARNTKTINKKLKLTVNNYFDEKKTQHEVIIYNFEKTNKYFRYELDGNYNLFKFFNTGDKSIRTVDIEDHNASKIETYTGSTLKELVDNIKENSKYVEPELLRIGSNRLKTKGYELYPNGFINRFGLLNSEVYHYTGQLPTIGSLVDYALRWDINSWDEKVWSGGLYQNGVFDLTVNYGKIPTNFNILELTQPLNNLQALVDKTKPFGTKAVCYFSYDVKFNLKMVINDIKTQIINDELFNFKFEDLGLISWYNRHDNSIAIFFDLTKYYLSIDDDCLKTSLSSWDKSFWDNKHIIDEVDMTYCMDVLTDNKSRQYIQYCYDIVENLQNTSDYIKNVTISKHNIDNKVQIPLHIYSNVSTNNRLRDEGLYNFYFDYDIDEEEQIGIYTETEEGNYYCKLTKDKLIPYKFELIHPNGTVINTIYKENINNFKMQVQCFELDNIHKIIHFWIATNEQDYEYLGYYLCLSTYSPLIFLFNKTSSGNTNNRQCTYTYTFEKDDPITFSIDDNKKYIKPKYSELYQTNSKYQWKNLNNLGQQPATIKTLNDTECKEKSIKPPKLMFRYDTFHLDNTDEIKDIYFDIKTSNKIENIKAGVFKDGSTYLPKKGIASKIYTPHHIDNVIHEYNSTVNIQQPNITICSTCMKTSLGYYDKCPHCSSELVTHQKEKQDVTICYNCGWVSDGWRTHCKHCLSKDVIRTVVDYNKTYCYNCQSIHDDYYNACPYCFSKNIIHLQNDVDMYRIYNQDITNIKPIVIQSDIEGAINACNITIPLNHNSKKLNELSSLNLVMNVTNNNNGEYYYCDTCKTAGLGNPEKCPECNETNPNKYHIVNLYDDDGNKQSNLNISVYSVVNGETKICEIIPNGNVDGTVDIKIPILDLAKTNTRDDFTLIIDAENITYHTNKNKINKSGVANYGETYLNEILKSIFMDMSINNFYFESEFINENKWDIRNIEGENRSGIRYLTDSDETNYLSFHFDVDMSSVDDIEFYMSGINKSLSYARMNIKVISNGKIETIKTFARSNLFEIKEKIYNKNLNPRDITIEVNFYDVNLNSEIIINECYLIANKNTTKITVPQLNEDTIIIDNYDNKHYKISSSNMWGINNTSPMYLTGKMLDTSLLTCFEFENINIGDILKIYDIQMIIVYKNKFGNIITNSIRINKNDLIEQINEATNESLDIINDSRVIQMVNAQIAKHNSENWGAFKIGDISLNNLEYEIINTTDEKLLDSIPVLNSIYQSFKPKIDSFYKIILSYAGRTGYPSDYITISIYNDFNNTPDICLASKKVIMPKIMQDVEIDFYISKVDTDDQYWIVIEDDSADEFNYHKIRHNTHKEIGNLYTKQNGVSTLYDHMALSFAIQGGYDIQEFINYPHTCELNLDENIDFKLYDSFYRLDAQTSSNVYLNNLLIKNGYKLCEYQEIQTRDEEEIDIDEVWNGPIENNNNNNGSIFDKPDCTNVSLNCPNMPTSTENAYEFRMNWDENEIGGNECYNWYLDGYIYNTQTNSKITELTLPLEVYYDGELIKTFTSDNIDQYTDDDFYFNFSNNEDTQGLIELQFNLWNVISTDNEYDVEITLRYGNAIVTYKAKAIGCPR